MHNNRGACCHVAGDIDFDSHNNLWMVTGDDTPAGGGNAGGFGPFNGQLTNESQTVARHDATGGTFTLTFDGQTTAPIAVPARQRRRSRRRSRRCPNLDDVAVTGNAATRTVNFRGNKAEQDVPLMTGGRIGLTGTTPTLTVAMATGNNGQGLNIAPRAGCSTPRTSTPGATAQNTNDLRGKLLRIKVKDGDITAGRGEHASAARTPSRPGTCSRVGHGAGPGPRSTRWASGTRSGSRSTRTTSRTSATTRPTRSSPQQFRGPAGTGRFEIVRQPGELRLAALLPARTSPYYKWNFNTSHAAAERGRARAERLRQPDARPAEHVALGRERRPGGRAGPRVRAADHQPGDLVLVPRQQRRERSC